MGRKKEVQEVKNNIQELVWIDISNLTIGENIRKHVPQRLIDAMAESISANMKAGRAGIDKPLDVEKVDGKWVIHDGQVRYLGAKKAVYYPLPCLVRSGVDVRSFQLQSFLRNDPGPMEEARAYQEQLILSTGKTEKDIRRRLMLLNLEPEIQKSIETGEISAGHGVILAQIPKGKERIGLLNLIKRRKMSVASAAEEIRGGVGLSMGKFDKTKCKDCPHCNLDFPELFDNGLAKEFKGECRNEDCFNLKQKEWAIKTVETMREKGQDAVLVDTDDTYNERWTTGKEFSKCIRLHDWNLPNKKCKTCSKIRQAILTCPTDGTYKFCTDPACYKKLSKDSSGDDDGNKPVKDLAEVKQGNRVHETTFRYLKEQIATNMNWHVALFVATMEFINDKVHSENIIEIFAKHLHLNAKERENLEDEYYGNSFKPLLQAVKQSSVGSESRILSAIMGDAMVAYFKEGAVYTNGQLEEFANMCTGCQTIKNFRVTEEYLNRMTKDALKALVGEFKLELPKLEKKGDLVKFILDNAPDQCPKEISEQKFEEDDDEN